MSNEIAPGSYAARAVRWQLGKAGTGKVQIGVRFVLLDADGAPNGPRLLWYGTFTAEALEPTVRALRAMGWKGKDLRELARPELRLDENEVEVTVESETFDGRTRTRIAWVNAPGIPMKETLTAGELDSLATKANDALARL